MKLATPTSLLGRALLGNSVFSLVCGLSFVAGATAFGAAFGIPFPLALQLVGFALIGYAIALFLLATRAAIAKVLALAASILDFGWVAGSLFLLVLPDMPFTVLGREVTGVLALLVALFGITQLIGLGSKAKSSA
jgi:hypothetical protein